MDITLSFRAFPNGYAIKENGKIKKIKFPIKSLYSQPYLTETWTKFDGGKGFEYNHAINIKVDNDESLTLLKNLTQSFVHSVAHYDNGNRGVDRLISSNCFFWDFDNKGTHDDMSFEEFKNSEFGKTYKWIAYASKSHAPELGQDCFHVLIPTATTFTAGEGRIYRKISEYLTQSRGIKCDNTFDVSRQINPACDSDERELRDGYFFENHDGEYLDVSRLKEEFVKIEAAAAAKAAADQKAFIKRREEGLKSRVKPKVVNYYNLTNPHEQVKAILVKRAGHPSLDKAVDDLAYDICSSISEEDYAEWILIGNAIKRFAGDSGIDLWETFCRNGSKFSNKDVVKYNTFRVAQDGVIQQLLKYGEDRGWVVPEHIARDIIGIDWALKDSETSISKEEIAALESLYAKFEEKRKLTLADSYDIVNGVL